MSACRPAWKIRTTREVAAAASCAGSAHGLSATAPQDLVAASDRVVERYHRDPFSGRRHYNPVIYAPVLDGDVLSADPLTAVAAGRARDTDLLVCHTTEEFWLFDAVGATAKVTTEQQLARFAEDFDLPAELVDRHRGRMPGAAVHDVYLAILSDLFFSGYSSRLAKAHARSGGRTFLSRFDRRRSSPRGTVRAWHCADVPFAFGNVDADCVEFLIGGPPTRQDHELSRRMVRAWADFAAMGEPGWPAVDDDADHARIWATDDGGEAEVDIRAGGC